MEIPEAIQLEVSKALRQLQFVDRTFHLGIWADDSKDKWQHDLEIMRMFNDLKDVRLELIGADRTVMFEFRIAFAGGPSPQRGLDSGNGIELPVLDLRAVVDKRVIVGHCGKRSQYQNLLAMNWTPAVNHVKRDGDTYGSEHTAKITGGRQTGSFHVGSDLRHRLVVSRTGPRGYAFAKDLDLGTADVFLHPKFAPPGFVFFVGQQVRCVVVQTPRGFQGRNIRLAD
jgi:hypothetical protein